MAILEDDIVRPESRRKSDARRLDICVAGQVFEIYVIQVLYNCMDLSPHGCRQPWLQVLTLCGGY